MRGSVEGQEKVTVSLPVFEWTSTANRLLHSKRRMFVKHPNFAKKSGSAPTRVFSHRTAFHCAPPSPKGAKGPPNPRCKFTEMRTGKLKHLMTYC
jgi:hypothetical protein